MVVIQNPKRPVVQAIFLKGHLKLVAAGLTPPRGVSRRSLLDKAGAITGKRYKRGAYLEAANDLAAFITENQNG